MIFTLNESIITFIFMLKLLKNNNVHVYIFIFLHNVIFYFIGGSGNVMNLNNMLSAGTIVRGSVGLLGMWYGLTSPLTIAVSNHPLTRFGFGCYCVYKMFISE